MPKVSESSLCKQVDLLAFHPLTFSSSEDEWLLCLCPVLALRHYVNKMKALRNKGKPISRQCLSHWVMGLGPLEGLRAHSTRGMATSMALFKGVSVQNICAALNWASPHTYVRFYRLDITEPSLAHSVLNVLKKKKKLIHEVVLFFSFPSILSFQGIVW